MSFALRKPGTPTIHHSFGRPATVVVATPCKKEEVVSSKTTGEPSLSDRDRMFNDAFKDYVVYDRPEVDTCCPKEEGSSSKTAVNPSLLLEKPPEEKFKYRAVNCRGPSHAIITPLPAKKKSSETAGNPSLILQEKLFDENFKDCEASDLVDKDTEAMKKSSETAGNPNLILQEKLFDENFKDCEVSDLVDKDTETMKIWARGGL